MPRKAITEVGEEQRPKSRKRSRRVCKPTVVVDSSKLTTSGSYKTGIKPLGLKSEIRHAIKNLSEDLPPISDIEQMFDHLVSRVGLFNVGQTHRLTVQVPDVVKIVERLNGRKLRVATMCS